MRSLRAASIIAVHLYTGCPPVSSLNYNACKTLPLDLYRAPRFCHITPLVTELHGLNIKHRIDFKIILTYKAIHGAAPPNITDLISLKPNSKYGQRSNDTLLLQPPPSSWGQAFWAAAPILWNSLPQELREEHRIGSFKKKLKTYLFKKAYILTSQRANHAYFA